MWKVRMADPHRKMRTKFTTERWNREHWARRLIGHAVTNSKRKGFSEPTITEQWVLDRLQANGGKCPYTGRSLNPLAGKRHPDLPSLDRIDNDKGYTVDNVELTSWHWNKNRNSLSFDDMRRAIRALDATARGLLEDPT